MNDWCKITLENLSGGAAIEMFQEAFQEVLENILDDNTEPDRIREIKLSVKFKPDKNDRKKVAYILDVDKKLAPLRPIGNFMFVGKEDNEQVAYEQNIEQGNLFQQYDDKIKQIKGVENA